ncbi:MAG: hypothetical protein QXT26_08620 [Thermoproteota archaeon]
MIESIRYPFLGLVGALLYVLIWSRKWEDLRTYEVFRHLAVGVVSGYIYSILHTEYSFPNSVMAVVVGYFGPDLMQALLERLRAALVK